MREHPAVMHDFSENLEKLELVFVKGKLGKNLIKTIVRVYDFGFTKKYLDIEEIQVLMHNSSGRTKLTLV
jgi:hypothetical protein